MPNCEVRHCPNFKFRRKEDNVHVRFHKYPTSDEWRWQWEEWVTKSNGVQTFDNQSKRFLCSDHFDRKCYTPSMSLRRSAVPSILPKTSHTSSVTEGMENSCQSAEALVDIGNVSRLSNESQTTGNGGIYKNDGVSPELYRTVQASVDNGNVSRLSSETQTTGDSGIYENDGVSPEPATSGSRKRDRMAFIGDLTLADLTTPGRAERSLALIKQRDKMMQDRIHALQKSLRICRQKIRDLEGIKFKTQLLDLENQQVNLQTSAIEARNAKMSKILEKVQDLKRAELSQQKFSHPELTDSAHVKTRSAMDVADASTLPPELELCDGVLRFRGEEGLHK